MATVPSSLVGHDDGASFLSIILTVFVTSLRNALFTSVLAPYVRKKSGIFPPLFAYGLTDECFAFNLVAVKGNEDGSPEEDQTINLISMLDRSISSSLGCYLGIFLQLVPGPCFLYPYGHVPWHRVKLYGFTDPCHGRHCLRSHICLFSTFIPFKLHIVLTNLIASISFTVLTRKKEARHE